MFKIEKNVELPNKKIEQFPLTEMEIGDSFVMPLSKIQTFRIAVALEYAKFPEKKFITKKNQEKTHYRVWRKS